MEMKHVLITGLQDQLTDIKADSARWIAERTRNSQINRQNGGGISPRREAEKSRQSNMTPDGYRASATRARQQDQPSPYSPNAAAPVYGGQQMPQASIPQPQYDQYGRLLPQQPQYAQQDYPQQGGQQPYTYGQPVQYGVNQPLQAGRSQQPSQPYPQAPAAGYPQGGRGMDTRYGLQDSRSQYDTSAYGGSLGRSQPMPPQQQYATSGQSIDPYAYQRGA